MKKKKVKFTVEENYKKLIGSRPNQVRSIRAASRELRSFKLTDSVVGVAPNEYPQPIALSLV